MALSRRQVIEIQDNEFHQDTARLIRVLEGNRFRRWRKVAVLALILLSAPMMAGLLVLVAVVAIVVYLVIARR